MTTGRGRKEVFRYGTAGPQGRGGNHVRGVLCYLAVSLLFPALFSCKGDRDRPVKEDIIIENSEIRLVLSTDGRVQSLFHKPTGQECLQQGQPFAAFVVTLEVPYNNELQLKSMAKTLHFTADSLSWDGQCLEAWFPALHLAATLRVTTNPHYLGFSFEGYSFRFPHFGDQRKYAIDAFTLLQLPVKDRKYFGEWLNVMWDDELAVNLLATTPSTRIDAERVQGYRILKGEMVAETRTKEAGVALVVTGTDRLLDRIAAVEEDFGLPRGVESRRSPESAFSYMMLSDVTPDNVDEYLRYARLGGFRAIQLYYYAFAKTMGHYGWNARYPQGMADLLTVVERIREAGMVPGLHFHYCKAQKEDPYVSPVPDHRLNLIRQFTLSESVGSVDDRLFVEEIPLGCTLDEGRRILKVGMELVEYAGFTDTPPYAFTGCRRGLLGSRAAAHEKGLRMGLLDIDNWPIFVRFDQRTGIQQEVAARLAEIFNAAGFRFAYYDGAEDVHAPQWYHVSNAQLQVHEKLNPAPLFAEGAFKSHFSWHILSRGNAFDTFAPEFIRDALRANQIPAAVEMAKSFTPVNFGWIKDELPGENSTGLQPDMVEYVCSRATAWNCPVSLKGDLERLRNHPRVLDNLEVFRRWEEFRLSGRITEQQRKALQNTGQEHLLLLDGKEGYQLLPYSRIDSAAAGSPALRAFLYERNGKTGVVYWHPSGEGQLEIALEPGSLRLFEGEFREIQVEGAGKQVVLPLGGRRYLECTAPAEQVRRAFRECKVL